MKETLLCQGCWEQMHVPIAIRGPFSLLFKPFGIKKSRMHPNLCTICESMFTRVMKKKQVALSITILFADIRGYTNLSQHIEATRLNTLLHNFYDHCSEAVWEQDGIINKFIGDAVLAIFNFPLTRDEHAANAVQAALRLQESCRDLKDALGESGNEELGIGIGIHTGECFMGEVGTSYKDFTAIGPVVNLASRLQSAAGRGETVVSAAVYEQVKERFPSAQKKSLTLKGVNHPVEAYVLSGKTLAQMS